jgi:hypothetical protein
MDADTLAAYGDVDTLAGLEGLEADSMEDQLAVLGALANEELGARYRAQMRGRQRSRPQVPLARGDGAPQRMPMRQLESQIRGVPARGLRKTWLPLGALVFNAAGLATQNLIVQSQRPFRGTRLVFALSRTGATATGLMTLTQIVIGQDNQPAAQGAAPLDAFGPTAFDVDVDLDPTGPGINFTATIAISVLPGAADRVDVSGVLFGYNIK